MELAQPMPDAAPNGKSKYLASVLFGVLLALVGGILKETIEHAKHLATISAHLDALTKRVSDMEDRLKK